MAILARAASQAEAQGSSSKVCPSAIKGMKAVLSSAFLAVLWPSITASTKNTCPCASTFKSVALAASLHRAVEKRQNSANPEITACKSVPLRTTDSSFFTAATG